MEENKESKIGDLLQEEKFKLCRNIDKLLSDFLEKSNNQIWLEIHHMEITKDNPYISITLKID